MRWRRHAALAEQAAFVVGIDIADRFGDAGRRLAAERGVCNIRFALADGQALPFRDGSFDLVLSHAVIEHVADAPLYLRECARVLRRGGWMYLSTAPYLSFAGAHLPRLKIPVPLHLLLGRRLAFAAFRQLARHAPWALREPLHENSFIGAAERGERKRDDVLERVRTRRLRRYIDMSGLRVEREELHLTGTIRGAPRPIAHLLGRNDLVRDIFTSNIEYVLVRP
jgi:SAM-dependent methyltransferase